MNHAKCRWVTHKLSIPKSEYLLEHEKIELHSHLDTCASCRQKKALAEALEQVESIAPSPLSPFEERKIVSAALGGRMPHAPKIEFFHYQNIFKWALGVAAGVAVVILIVGLTYFPSQPTAPTAKAKHLVTNPSAPPAHPANEPLSSATAPVSNGSQVAFTAKKTMEHIHRDKIWGTPGTLINVHNTSKKITQVELVQGKLVASVNKRKTGQKFVVHTPQFTVEVIGTIFTVDITDVSNPAVRVIKGKVKVIDNQTNEVHFIAANHQWVLRNPNVQPTLRINAQKDLDLIGISTVHYASHDKSRPRHAPKARQNAIELASAAINEKRLSDAHKHIEIVRQRSPQSANVPSLLARLARAYRQQKNYGAAKDTYLRLVREYGHTNTGQNAIVALGQLELNILDKKQAALGHFETYLQRAPKGYLSEEAWVGSAHALRFLGQRAQLLQTTNQYLKQYPQGSFAADMLLYRATIRAQQNNCALAQKDYSTIIQTWPNSKKARLAHQRSTRCQTEQQ